MTDITTAIENVKMGLGDTLRPDVYLAALSTIEAELAQARETASLEYQLAKHAEAERDEAVAALREVAEGGFEDLADFLATQDRIRVLLARLSTPKEPTCRCPHQAPDKSGETYFEHLPPCPLSTPEEPTEAIYVCADPRHAARLSTPKEPTVNTMSSDQGWRNTDIGVSDHGNLRSTPKEPDSDETENHDHLGDHCYTLGLPLSQCYLSPQESETP